MGKNLNGKELGKGLYQRKDGRYEARIFVRGTGKTFSIYGTNLQHVKKERNTYLANISPGIERYDPRISVSKWYEKCLNLYVYDSHRFLEACKNTRCFELFFFCILACVLEKLLLWNGVILILNEKNPCIQDLKQSYKVLRFKGE